jgi:RNA polymerase sigma-70 factor (ECF subfamily)
MDESITEDIVSDVFYKSFKSIKKFSGSTEKELSSWMYRIAYNSVIDYYRTKKEHIELESIEETQGMIVNFSGNIDDNTTIDNIQEFLKRIPDEQKNIIIMRIWDDLSYKEISSITGKNVDTCKKIVSRILIRIAANVTFLFLFVCTLQIVVLCMKILEFKWLL